MPRQNIQDVNVVVVHIGLTFTLEREQTNVQIIIVRLVTSIFVFPVLRTFIPKVSSNWCFPLVCKGVEEEKQEVGVEWQGDKVVFCDFCDRVRY